MHSLPFACAFSHLIHGEWHEQPVSVVPLGHVTLDVSSSPPPDLPPLTCDVVYVPTTQMALALTPDWPEGLKAWQRSSPLTFWMYAPSQLSRSQAQLVMVGCVDGQVTYAVLSSPEPVLPDVTSFMIARAGTLAHMASAHVLSP